MKKEQRTAIQGKPIWSDVTKPHPVYLEYLKYTLFYVTLNLPLKDRTLVTFRIVIT